MKLLKPSLRSKKRYILFEIRNCSWDACKNDILKQIKEFLGSFIFGMSEFMIVNNLSKGRFFVARVNKKYVDVIKASIIFINKVNNQKISIRSISVSGTLKKIKKRLYEILNSKK